jgi:hypothetical protein
MDHLLLHFGAYTCIHSLHRLSIVLVDLTWRPLHLQHSYVRCLSKKYSQLVADSSPSCFCVASWTFRAETCPDVQNIEGTMFKEDLLELQLPA